MEVVIVDDDPVNLAFYEGLLEQKRDIGLKSFERAEDAIAYCSKSVPDLLIADYMMPGIDGIECVRRFCALPGCDTVPVIMVTANADRDVRRRALEVGAADFLSKPVDGQEFCVRVRNMLRLREAYSQIQSKAKLLTAEIARATEKIRANERDTLYALARAAEYRDPETGAHILRMANYTRLIARQLGLSEEEQDVLLQAAPLHDLGKIGIPDSILLKPGPLSPEERKVMETHATIGWQILGAHTSPILQAGALIAHSHHEKFDGNGYPRALAGEQIPLYGRIVAVADVFDALTSVRPYKDAWAIEAAESYLRDQAGAHFDPQCVQGLLRCWDEVKETMRVHPD